MKNLALDKESIQKIALTSLEKHMLWTIPMGTHNIFFLWRNKENYQYLLVEKKKKKKKKKKKYGVMLMINVTRCS